MRSTGRNHKKLPILWTEFIPPFSGCSEEARDRYQREYK